MNKRVALAIATPAVALALETGVLTGTTRNPAMAAPPPVPVTSSHQTAKAEALAARFYRPFETGRTSDYDRVLTKNWVDRPLAEGQGSGRDGLKPVSATSAPSSPTSTCRSPPSTSPTTDAS